MYRISGNVGIHEDKTGKLYITERLKTKEQKRLCTEIIAIF